MAQYRDQKHWQGPDLSITSFEVTDPILEDGNWKVTAIATVAYRRKSVPMQPCNVIFDLNGTPCGNPLTIDSTNGRAILDIPISGAGAYLIGTQIENFPMTRKVRRIVLSKKMKKIAPPLVRAEGDEGDYLISICVSYEEGGPAENIPVRFIISILGKPAEIRDEEVDRLGFATYHLTFKETEADITIQIIGYEKKIENLYGPSRFPRPPEIPEASAVTLKSGLKATLKWFEKKVKEHELRHKRKIQGVEK